jgi:hypothetical protein
LKLSQVQITMNLGQEEEVDNKSNTQSYISLGVQAGDEKADVIIKPFYIKLRKLLSEKCSRGYGEKFKELAFVLRIDGTIWHWEKSGCDNLRVKKSGEATIDIFMPIDIWTQANNSLIQQFLFEEIKKGFSLMIERLVSKGIMFEKDNLITDFESAMASFVENEM